jgi:hypothetical protein
MKTFIPILSFTILALICVCAIQAPPFTHQTTLRPSFESPKELTRLLEQRWSLKDIQAFCIPQRRHNFWYQNLVCVHDRWEGELYPDTVTGFDRIRWYADVEGDTVTRYSLGVKRGEDWWLLEIGTPELTRKIPQVTPDPSAEYFFGNRTMQEIFDQGFTVNSDMPR